MRCRLCRSAFRHPAGGEEKLMQNIITAIDDAYHVGTLILLREYPAENVAMDGRLQSDNPKILEALKKITAT